MRKRIEMLGRRYGRLVVIASAGRDRLGNHRFNCLCDCGTTTGPVLGTHLRRGQTRSCGCLVGEAARRNLAKARRVDVRRRTTKFPTITETELRRVVFLPALRQVHAVQRYLAGETARQVERETGLPRLRILELAHLLRLKLGVPRQPLQKLSAARLQRRQTRATADTANNELAPQHGYQRIRRAEMPMQGRVYLDFHPSDKTLTDIFTSSALKRFYILKDFWLDRLPGPEVARRHNVEPHIVYRIAQSTRQLITGRRHQKLVRHGLNRRGAM